MLDTVTWQSLPLCICLVESLHDVSLPQAGMSCHKAHELDQLKGTLVVQAAVPDAIDCSLRSRTHSQASMLEVSAITRLIPSKTLQRC